MLEEQKIYGSQFVSDCSPEALKELLHRFCLFLKKLHLDSAAQLEWQRIFEEATKDHTPQQLVASWSLRGDAIYLEIFYPKNTKTETTYQHDNITDKHGVKQIISKSYPNLHNTDQPQATIYELEIASEFQKENPTPSQPPRK